MYFDFKEFIDVEDSKTEYNVLRIDILNNLMKILSENSDSSYPQKIFELGKVFELDKNSETGLKEKENLSIAIAGDDANFTEIKRILDYLFKMLDKQYHLEPCENSNYISGRAGKLFAENRPKEGSRINEIMKEAVYLAKNAARFAHLSSKAEKTGEKEEIGTIGEISPRVLSNFKLKMPVAAIEIDLDKLFEY
jgi:phenylalanyl-tRNA synthetase beta chain